MDLLHLARVFEHAVVHVGRSSVMSPGPDLAGWLHAISTGALGPLPTWDPADLLDAAVAAHRQLAWSQAQLLTVLAALDGALAAERDAEPDGPAVDAARAAVPEAGDEFAAAAVVTPGAADRLVRLARTLTDRLPESLTALGAGELDLAKVQLAAAAVQETTDEAAAAVDAAAVAQGRTRTSRQLQPLLAREVLRADPDAAAARRRYAVRQRHVAAYPEADGMATLHCVGTAEQVVGIVGVLDALAAGPRTADDQRTVAQRRMDALHAVVTGAIGPDGLVPDPQDALRRVTRRGAELRIVVDRAALLGESEEPAHLTGYGPVAAQVARDVAADARWRRLLVDAATGSLLDVGQVAYAPSRRLRRFVRTRDGTCAFPRCTRPAERCDLDHSRNWPRGPTCPCNLEPLCRRHHNLKTAEHWRLTQPSPGVFEWESRATGQRHTVRPEPPWRLVTGAVGREKRPPGCPVHDPGPPPF